MNAPTNAIRFELGPLVAPRFGIGVEIRIDGASLIDTFRRLEAPWWASRSLPQPDAPYVWVPARIALLPNRHLLGVPADERCGESSAVVVCNCGEYECRAYAVRVVVSGSEVLWWDWTEIPPEEARLTGRLPRFRFDLAQYESELVRVSEEYGSWRESYSPGDWGQ